MNNKTYGLIEKLYRQKDLMIPLSLITLFVAIDIGHNYSFSPIELNLFLFDIIIELLILFSTGWLGFSLAKYYFNEGPDNILVSNKIEELSNELKNCQGKSDSLKKNYQNKLNNYLCNKWKLSKAEIEVTKMILKGLSYKEIAKQRFLSEKTIRNQSQSIFEKSGLGGRKELSAFFLNDLIG